MELLSVGVGTRIMSSFPELVSTVKALHFSVVCGCKELQGLEGKSFDLPRGSKLLFESDF